MDEHRLSDLLARADDACRGLRTGGTDLGTAYERLADLLAEAEQQRLEHPREAVPLRILERHDPHETAAVLAYTLGQARAAFEHAERARSRTLLDRTLNKVPFD